MATYIELKEQAEKLMAQAEQMRQQETQQAIDDIKAKMKAYGLTARDLGFSTGSAGGAAGRPRAAKRAAGGAAKAPAKYKGPNGELWSGGRGRKPQWVVDALAKGRKLEEFEIK